MADNEKFHRNPKKSRIKYISNGSSKKNYIFIFQKLIANSMGDLNLQLFFNYFFLLRSFQKYESHFYGSMSKGVKDHLCLN
jgi:hypothetical protein